MIEDAEKRALTPYENIRAPRPWETETDEKKTEYLKQAYTQAGEEIERRERDEDAEEKRIQEQIALIKAKHSKSLQKE